MSHHTSMRHTAGFSDLHKVSMSQQSHTFRPSTSRAVLGDRTAKHNQAVHQKVIKIERPAATERKLEQIQLPIVQKSGPIVLVPNTNPAPAGVINVLAHITTNWMKAPQPANVAIQPGFDCFSTVNAFDTFGSIQSYLVRMQARLGVNEQVFIPVAIYIDRFVKATKFHITSTNIHKLLATSILLAMKFWETWNRRNSSFGRVAEIDGRTLNKMEFVFFRALNFSLHITSTDFDKYRAKIQQYAKIHQIKA